MNGISDYIIVKELKLIVVYYSGDITGSDIRNLMDRLSHDPDYSPEFDSISDFRHCKLIISPVEIDSYISFIKDQLKIVANRKTAFLTNDPTKVVITTLFSKKAEVIGLNSQVFSTVNALLKFLKKDSFSLSKYEEIIDNLRSLQKSTL